MIMLCFDFLYLWGFWGELDEVIVIAEEIKFWDLGIFPTKKNNLTINIF